MDQLTFGNAAALLRANGFAPIPLGDDGKPLGPVYVTQTDWVRFPSYADSPVAVLTSSPMASGPHAPIQNAADTWLVTVAVSVRHEVKADIDAIVKRYAGAAKSPVRVTDDEALYVFKLAGARFSTLATAYGHQPDAVRVESAASFVPVNGDWANGISLLDVFRDDLAPVSRDHAQALIDEVDRLLADRAPRVEYFPLPVAPRPLLQSGERLTFGNSRAMDALREHGFQPVAVRWGQQHAEKDGFSDANGRWHFNCDVSEHGVGINLRGFALIEFTGRFRADVDEAIRSMGACLVRTARGDDRHAYLFHSSQGGTDETLYSPNVHVCVHRTGLVVLSGADEDGRTYQWDRDVLTITANELGTFEQHDGKRLERMLEALPPADYSKATAKRRKSA
jgi:hypothetical protein